jgi:ribosomal protein L2
MFKAPFKFKINFFSYFRKNIGGRNNQGDITIPRRGHLSIKRFYRFIDNKRRIFPNEKLFLLSVLKSPFRQAIWGS